MAQSKSQMDHELVWMPVQALARGLKRAPPPPWTLVSWALPPPPPSRPAVSRRAPHPTPPALLSPPSPRLSQGTTFSPLPCRKACVNPTLPSKACVRPPLKPPFCVYFLSVLPLCSLRAGQNPQSAQQGPASSGGAGRLSGARAANVLCGGAAASKQPRPKAQARHRLTEDNFYQAPILSDTKLSHTKPPHTKLSHTKLSHTELSHTKLSR
jgi:hypothetical protein